MIKIDKVHSSVELIEKIIQKLKNFSRSSNDHVSEPVYVKKLISDSVALAELKAKETATVISTTGDSNPQIACNEIEIEQVLLNLINNAIDATKDLKERWVEVSLQETADKVIIKITDAGAGTPKEIQASIFDPFYSTKPIGKGTGLGLSITKGILKSHDARIEVDSDSKNTCFILTFKKYKS